MHNPRIVIALATWLTITHLGHVFVMSYNKDYESCSHRKDAEDVAVYRRRVTAGSTAYAIGFLAALGYLISRRHRSNRITYYAVAAIILFGLTHAIYLAWPKLYRDDPTIEDQDRRRRGARLSESVHFIAIVGALLAWFLSGNMKPLPAVSDMTREVSQTSK